MSLSNRRSSTDPYKDRPVDEDSAERPGLEGKSQDTLVHVDSQKSLLQGDDDSLEPNAALARTEDHMAFNRISHKKLHNQSYENPLPIKISSVSKPADYSHMKQLRESYNISGQG